MNKIIISKQKIFLATIEEGSEKWAKKDIDRLGKPLPWYLPYEVEIEKNVTVKDFLLLLKKHEDHINLVFCGYLGEAKLADFIAELSKEPDPDATDKIEMVEFCWKTELDSAEESLDPDELGEFQIIHCPTLRGICSVPEEEQEDNIIFENEFDLALVPLRNYFNCPILINTYVEYSTLDDVSEPLPNVLLDGEMVWTFFDLVSSFLSEISYYGTPEDQKIMHDEIMKETAELENEQDVIEQDELFTYLDSLEQRLNR